MERELELAQPECPECHSRLYSVPVFKKIGTQPKPLLTNSAHSTDMLLCYHCLQKVVQKPSVEPLFELKEN